MAAGVNFWLVTAGDDVDKLFWRYAARGCCVGCWRDDDVTGIERMGSVDTTSAADGPAASTVVVTTARR
jgi:hypothetical protein